MRGVAKAAAVRTWCVGGALAVALPFAMAQQPPAAMPDAASEATPGAGRQRELVRMVRQDCGSCHGLRLTGGLGPALDAPRMAAFPLDALLATIRNGRPGTPMPGWSRLIPPADSLWIAQQLQRGFPELP
jgi:cytochrome c55X